MRKIVTRLAAGSLLLLIGLTPLGPATGQPPQLPEACQELAFSTEEDFVWDKIIVSDGDLLTVYEDASGNTQCQICATNAELVNETFDVPFDLGLDAADVVEAATYLVAFSTELTAPDPTRFTHGDLLVTNGVVIPNQSLTNRLGVGYDLGLDGLHFVGDPETIITFLGAATQFSREDWLRTPDLLASMLDGYGIDIWFSTEGTWTTPEGAAGFLDGDLLSALSGSIVATNALLLDPSVPADVRDDGVDFGLDAATSTRTGLQRPYIRFSTEILFDGEVSFTDGDVLLLGNGVVVPHGDLIGCFKPAADFLGLDALHMAVEVPEGEIHGQKFHDLNANGVVDDGEPGLGQWEIHLDSVDGLDAVVNEVAFTDASGAYAFTVPFGTYTVSEVCPAGAAWYQSLPVPPDGVCGSGVHTIILDADNPLHTGIDFGNYLYALKSGYKFHDLKPDGEWDQENEPPLVEWRILLNGADGMNNPVSEEAWTDQNGFYSFTVPPGGYRVSEVCYDGWAQSWPLPDPPGACGSGVYDIELVSAEIRENNNFGNYEPIDLYLPIIVKDGL